MSVLPLFLYNFIGKSMIVSLVLDPSRHVHLKLGVYWRQYDQQGQGLPLSAR